MKTSSSNKTTLGDLKIINAFISELKKIGINSDIKIFEGKGTYIFYITNDDEEEYQNNIGELVYQFNKTNYNS